MSGAWLPDDVPIRSRLIPLSSGRMFATDVGPGAANDERPPLVLIHGLFVTHHVFHRVIPAWAAKRRVVALDLPGCGDSDHPAPEDASGYSAGWLASAVSDAVSALGIEHFDLLGHDLGGAVALALAASEPARVRRLVLCDPLALAVSLPLPGALALAPTLGAEVCARTLRRTDVKSWLSDALSTPELLDPDDLDVYWDRLGRQGASYALHAMLRDVGLLARLRERLDSVTAPTLVVWGDRDDIVPPEQGERLVELLSNGHLEILDGCGHDPAAEQPERLIDLVDEHTVP